MAAAAQPEIPPPSLDDVLYDKRDGWALITMNRPVVLNALNWSIQRRLWAALDQAEADDEVRAVVLTGAGRAFSSGGDLQSTPPPDGEPSPSGHEINLRIWRMAKPVIAAVRGYAVGQGHELAGMCDLTIAAEDAVFGELQIRHGFGPPILISPFLANPKQAKEILLLGERINAQDALRLGLANKVVPVESLLDEAAIMAKKLAALPERTVKLNKMLVNRVHELAGFYPALDYQSDPAIAELAGRQREGNEHLKALAEGGWENFRRSRDEVYGEQEARG